MIIDRLEKLSGRAWLTVIIGAIAVSLLATVVVELIYAEKYAVQVNVVKSTKTIGINPLTTSLDFGDLSLGGKSKRYVTVSNEGERASYVIIWMMGETGELTKIDRSSFSLPAGKKKKISFLLTVPASASSRVYRGRVYIVRLPKLL